MNLLIDNLDETTGWSVNGTAIIYGLNDHQQYIAGENDQSLIFGFSALNDYVEKTYGTDVSDYSEFVVHFWSQQKQSSVHKASADFSYKIDFGVGKEFLIPIWPGFGSVTFDISSINTIDRMRITALHADADFIVMSYAVVTKDEFPLDIFTGMISGLESIRDSEDTYLLGIITATVGDTTLDLSNLDYVDDYAVVKIDDGNNSEIHQLRRHDEGTYTFTDLYDGGTILNDYTGASIYLYFPVEFGRDTIEVILPSITVWGFEPEKIDRTFDIQTITDSWTDLGAKERREGHYLRWPLLIQCEARHDQILAHISTIVRKFIGRKNSYVNGKRLTLNFDGTSTETRPTQDVDIIPMISYRGVVELREELWERTSVVKTTTINTPVEIQ